MRAWCCQCKAPDMESFGLWPGTLSKSHGAGQGQEPQHCKSTWAGSLSSLTATCPASPSPLLPSETLQ